MKSFPLTCGLAALVISGASFFLGRFSVTAYLPDGGASHTMNTVTVRQEGTPHPTPRNALLDKAAIEPVKPVAPEISDEDEELHPGLRQARIASKRISGLAKGNLTEAIRACNEEMAAYPQAKLPQNTLPLESVLASSLYQTCFGRRCSFVGDSAEKLSGILKSDLAEPVKAALLKLSSAAGEGSPEISSNVLKIALDHSKSPTVLASIVSDIARINPEKAVETFGHLPWKPEFTLATSRLYAEYVMEDPQKGSAAAAALAKDSPAYQWAAAGIVQAIRGVDMESAQKWRDEITDPEAADYANALTYSLREKP